MKISYFISQHHILQIKFKQLFLRDIRITPDRMPINSPTTPILSIKHKFK